MWQILQEFRLLPPEELFKRPEDFSSKVEFIVEKQASSFLCNSDYPLKVFSSALTLGMMGPRKIQVSTFRLENSSTI